MSNEDSRENARVLVARAVAEAVGAAAGLAGPDAAVLGAAVTPFVESALTFLSERFIRRRVVNATETLTDAATVAGATDGDAFEKFLQRLVSDDQHEELLVRVLTTAQDSAMRDKRRALGRVLANAADETGTKVDNRLADARVIADLDPVHVRVLRIMSETSPSMTEYATAHGMDPHTVRRWYPQTIKAADPGLEDSVWGALQVLERHGLIGNLGDPIPASGCGPEYEITPYGDYFVELLATPAAPGGATEV